MESAISIIMETNTYFKNGRLNTFLNNCLMHISPQNFPLFLDSVIYFDLLYKYKINRFVNNPDLILVFYFILVSFHVSINKKRNDESIIDRFFLTETKKVKKIVKQMLEKMYPYKTDNDEKRWKCISTFAYKLIEVIPVTKQISVISEANFYLAEKEHLNYNETLLLLKFTFATSLISFFWNSKNVFNKAMKILAMDKGGEEAQQCLAKWVVTPAFSVLCQIFGKEFMSKLKGG